MKIKKPGTPKNAVRSEEKDILNMKMVMNNVHFQNKFQRHLSKRGKLVYLILFTELENFQDQILEKYRGYQPANFVPTKDIQMPRVDKTKIDDFEIRFMINYCVNQLDSKLKTEKLISFGSLCELVGIAIERILECILEEFQVFIQSGLNLSPDDQFNSIDNPRSTSSNQPESRKPLFQRLLPNRNVMSLSSSNSTKYDKIYIAPMPIPPVTIIDRTEE